MPMSRVSCLPCTTLSLLLQANPDRPLNDESVFDTVSREETKHTLKDTKTDKEKKDENDSGNHKPKDELCEEISSVSGVEAILDSLRRLRATFSDDKADKNGEEIGGNHHVMPFFRVFLTLCPNVSLKALPESHGLRSTT